MSTRKRSVLTGIGLAVALTVSGAQAQLVDPGFEANPLTSYSNVITNFPGYQGQWGVEAATITGVDGGVTPAGGARMLRMVDDGLVATQAFQSTDVTALAGIIDAGAATATLSALFNVGPNVPAGSASINLRFFSTSNWGSLIGGPVFGTLGLDNSSATWETALVTSPIPVGTRWIMSEVSYNNASLLGNPGYVDDALLRIVPEPASLALFALGGLAVLRRRNARA